MTEIQNVIIQTMEELRAQGGEVLLKNDIVVVDTTKIFQKNSSVIDSSKTSEDHLLGLLQDSRLAYDRNGNAFYIPSACLKRFGDPRDQPWFYPVEISSRQAALFLREEKQEGSFSRLQDSL